MRPYDHFSQNVRCQNQINRPVLEIMGEINILDLDIPAESKALSSSGFLSPIAYLASRPIFKYQNPKKNETTHLPTFAIRHTCFCL